MSSITYTQQQKLTSRPCEHPGCQNWAQRGADPPLCGVHSHQQSQVVISPPQGAQFYSGAYRESELALIASTDHELSVEEEIWLLRVINRRLMLEAEGADFDKLLRVANALGMGAWRVSQLMKDEKALQGGDSGLSAMIGQALDELSAELNLSL